MIVSSLAEQWTNVQTVPVRKLTFLTFFWGFLALLGWLAAILAHQEAAFAPYGRLSAVIFFGLLTASWITIAVQQVSNDVADRERPRHQVAALIANVPTIVIATLLVWSTVSLTLVGLAEPIQPLVTDYASCASSGGIVLQTNPAQCVTTTNTFTDPRGVQ